MRRYNCARTTLHTLLHVGVGDFITSAYSVNNLHFINDLCVIIGQILPLTSCWRHCPWPLTNGFDEAVLLKICIIRNLTVYTYAKLKGAIIAEAMKQAWENWNSERFVQYITPFLNNLSGNLSHDFQVDPVSYQVSYLLCIRWCYRILIINKALISNNPYY